MKRAEISTKSLSEMTGVPVHTIRRMAKELDGIPVGGRTGFLFPASAERQIYVELRRRHERGHAGRKPSRIKDKMVQAHQHSPLSRDQYML